MYAVNLPVFCAKCMSVGAVIINTEILVNNCLLYYTIVVTVVTTILVITLKLLCAVNLPAFCA